MGHRRRLNAKELSLNRSTVAGALAALVTLTAVPAFASPTDDVRAAMIKFASLSSYQVSFGSGGRTGTMDFVKPDSMHMRSSGVEMVRVNKITYMKMGPSSSWMKIPDSKGAGPGDIADRVRTMAKQANGVTATDLGMKSVDGETLHAYRMKQNNSTQSTVYIANDGYVHRIDSGEKDGTVRFSKFNQIAPIRAPI